MSRQTKFLIALAIAFISLIAINVYANNATPLFFPILRQGYYIAPTPSPTPSPTPTERPPGVYIEEFNPSEYPSSDYVVVINTQKESQNFTGWFMKNDKVWTPFYLSLIHI